MRKIRTLIMIGLDGAAWYAALLAMLVVRYSFAGAQERSSEHAAVFLGLFGIWVALFYIAGLYQDRAHKSASHLFSVFVPTLLVGGLISVVLFYLLVPFLILTPKTNLFLFVLFFAIFDFTIRVAWLKFSIKRGLRTTVMFIGNTPELIAAAEHIKANPYLGYDVSHIVPTTDEMEIRDAFMSDHLRMSDMLVLAAPIMRGNVAVQKCLCTMVLPMQKEFFDSVSFYETLFQKVPLEMLGEYWFVEKITPRHKTYHMVERLLDIVFALFVLIVFLPVVIVIALCIKLTSRGPLIYRQTRVGKGGSLFTLYKFRTMREDAERDGPKWAERRDPRTTAIGRILRFAHLDELPQLMNILKGDLSFVGPRPERPEFVEELRAIIPYYEIRHIVKPGLTGWTQINYRYGSSVDDAREKLQYDIYYLKKRSLMFDFLIIVKTVKFFIFNL